MLISLYLRNYRNHRELYLEFNKHVNNIYGPNALGKSNILEALYLLICGKSYRGHPLKQLVSFDEKSFHLKARFLKNGFEQTLSIQSNGKERKIYFNDSPYTSFTQILGNMQGVLFHPQDAELVSGPPKLRRQYLDIQLAQVDPLYVYYLGRYQKALHARNCLLKQKRMESMEVWEDQMALSAAYLLEKRIELVDSITEHLLKIQSFLSIERDQLSIHYKSSTNNEVSKQAYLNQLRKLRQRELVLGYSLSGPHREDFDLLHAGNPARLCASEGQKISTALALRLAEWEELKIRSGQDPIMAVDDFGKSLDPIRRQSLSRHLSDLGQSFVTSTERIEHPSTDFIDLFQILSKQQSLQIGSYSALH